MVKSVLSSFIASAAPFGRKDSRFEIERLEQNSHVYSHHACIDAVWFDTAVHHAQQRRQQVIQRVMWMEFAYIRRPLAFVLGISAFAWAIGFARYFDHWVFFSAFPNILDSLGMSLVGTYLLYEALGKRRRLTNRSDAESESSLSILDDIERAHAREA